MLSLLRKLIGRSQAPLVSSSVRETASFRTAVTCPLCGQNHDVDLNIVFGEGSVHELTCPETHENFVVIFAKLPGVPDDTFQNFMPESNAVSICEHLAANYHYHLGFPDSIKRTEYSFAGHRALCGETEIMRRSKRLDSLGHTSEHIGEKYCQECDRLGRLFGLKLPERREPK